MANFRPRYQIAFCFYFLLLIFTAGCSMDESEQRLTVTPQANLTKETSQVFSTQMPPAPTRSSAATSTREPTQTSHPTIPAESATPVTQSLPCPDQDRLQEELSQPVRILYANEDQLWVWDETNQDRTLVNLPPEAVAPHISPDGRFAAYLLAGQSYNSSENPLAEIPLGLFDLQSGQGKQVASFPVLETRQKYPESPHIYLQLRWLENSLEDRLLVEVYSEPWAETGCCPPRGDLYLVEAETGEIRRLLEGDAYNFYSIRPDGTQIAAVNLEGDLLLIDLLPGGSEQNLSLQLPENPWLVFAPVYSPDGTHAALQIEGGLVVIDTNSGSTQELVLENPCQDCYWGPRLPILWHPDGKRFFTTTTQNDHFDQRAETMLLQVNLGSGLELETLAVIQANPFTLNFSPDFRYLSYWNQPDWDSDSANEDSMNWVSLNLMEFASLESVLYEQQFGLRLSSWSPDEQHFLYTFSSTGGPNLDRKMFSLGNVCQPPELMPVPAGVIIDETRWLDAGSFLAWTLPADGVPDRYKSGFYLYRLGAGSQPVHIDDLLIDQTEPYGTLKQIAVMPQ